MNVLFPDVHDQRRLAMCLALIAGYVDAYGIRALGVYVSFMSGNTTQAGSFIGQAQLAKALASALAIVFFVSGASVATWLIHSGLRHARQLLLGMVVVSLALIIGATHLDALSAGAGIATLALAMGIMNTTQSQVGAESVSLTFVTGDLHRLGTHLALALKRAPLPGAQGPWDTHLRRASVLGRVWAAFLVGAALSVAATSRLGVWSLLLPCLILLALAPFSRADRVPAAPLRQAGAPR
jgi:uncharacterized membrane protein YoaK (UPF0700 family)